MSFDQDPNEQANISGADLAILVDELKALRAQLSASEANLARATNTLTKAGYTDCGGELWKPPLGPSASLLLDRIDTLEERCRVMREALEHCKKVFVSMADRGAYPEELLPDYEAFLGQIGFQFITEALSHPMPDTQAEGWRLVPTTATKEMCEAAHYGPQGAEETMTNKDMDWLQEMYAAMLAVAPKAGGA